VADPTDRTSAATLKPPRLAGQVAIVTGASRGIGKGLALGLSAEGAAVVCAARTEVVQPGGLPGTVHETAEAVAASGGRAIAVRCDISRDDDIARMVERTIDEFGRLDVLVNNAMSPTRGRFEDSDPSAWDEAIATNIRSLLVLCKSVLPHMASQGGGSIINISSGGAEHASTPYLPPGFAVYAMAKAAMERFTTAVAPELAERGIAINALRPGAVKTELAVHELGEDYDWSTWATPDAVVPAVVFLAAERGDGFTGRIVDSPRFGKDWP
jgi:NAD(P)-dependent dehydrogenase (short-subunit alcohol dehydrogenase family)